MHPSDKILKLYLDKELGERKSHEIERHLEKCSKCQTRAFGMGETSAWVAARLDMMSSAVSKQTISTALPQKILNTKESKVKTISLWSKLRPFGIGTAVLIALIIAFSFQPVRALASDLLRLFRAEKVSVVDIETFNLDKFTHNPTFAEILETVFAKSVTIIREKEEAKTNLDPETAKSAANFPARFPKDREALDIAIDSGLAFKIHVEAEYIKEILEIADKESLAIPDSLKDTDIFVDIPASITAVYGGCTKAETTDPDEGPIYQGSKDCLLLIQVPNPTVQVPSTFDPIEVADFAFQFLGMEPAESSLLSQEIDWRTTLVIPIPVDKATSKEVIVDGERGHLIQPLGEESGNGEIILIWSKNDIIYAVIGFGDAMPILDFANSLE